MKKENSKAKSKAFREKYNRLKSLMEAYNRIENFYASDDYAQITEMKCEHVKEVEMYIESNIKVKEEVLSQPFTI